MISVIIPVWNLVERGYDRVLHMLESLALQSLPASEFDVWIMDGSRPALQKQLGDMLKANPNLSGLRFHHVPVGNMAVFNKPVLLNTGMNFSKADYFVCTDADYLYSPDMLNVIMRNATPDTYLLHRVQMLQKRDVPDFLRIQQWAFPPCPDNEYGDLADGGCQVFHRDWFTTCGGYDERMQGWCGMDNDMTNRAKRAGMNVKWLTDGQILHQWHTIEKGRKREDRIRMQNNWKIRDTDTTIERNK